MGQDDRTTPAPYMSQGPSDGAIENLYDEEEIYPSCTVQVWRNSKTGEVSVGWWPNTEEGEQG